MKRFILIIAAALLLTSCGVSLVAYDDYYDSYPYPSYYYYYGGRPYYHYHYYYGPGYYRPVPPPPAPRHKPYVKPAPPRHDPQHGPSHQPNPPKPHGNNSGVRPHGGAPRGPASRSSGSSRGRRR